MCMDLYANENIVQCTTINTVILFDEIRCLHNLPALNTWWPLRMYAGGILTKHCLMHYW